MKKLYWKYWRK